jgi:glycosidase
METRFLSYFSNGQYFPIKKSGVFVKILLIFLSLSNIQSLTAQKKSNSFVERIDPPMWWSGMKWSEVEFLVKGTRLNQTTAEIISGQAEIISLKSAPNPNYLYLTVRIPESPKNQDITIKFIQGRRSHTIKIPIRPKSHIQVNPVNESDVIYLITPDRFANGNPKNDRIPEFFENTINRKEPFSRHGGDIQGIADKIDYLKNLGVSALWISPLLENNQPRESYHGYAITDLYRIDPRMGTLEEYLKLSESLQSNGIKLIKDMVFNHFGDKNYLFTDIPDSNWYHWWPTFTRTNYRATTLMDPYRSEYDYKLMTEGWFDTHMPDLNQKNPHLAKYLIQNTLYWIEIARLNGIRIDTYAYCDQDFMNQWITAVKNEYPELYVVAEIWEHTVPPQLFFDNGLPQRQLADTKLDGITDFQLHFAIMESLNREPGWAEGLNKLYYILASDYLYKNPERHLTFLDNHDVARIFGILGRDWNKMKLALGWLLTLRGIPCLYYGTEILMSETEGHGKIRQDFPGGWPDDTINKFTPNGRTSEENIAFEFIRDLIGIRKNHPTIANGKLTQYVPRGKVYFYTLEDQNTGRRYIVFSSISDKEELIKLDANLNILEMKYLFGDALTLRDKNTEVSIVVRPYSFSIYEIK